jgi:hypothetical protein
MDPTTVRIIAGIAFVIVLCLLIYRLKQRKG